MWLVLNQLRGVISKHQLGGKVSFELPPGQTLGIFGPVGSGKTTIATLLTRLYDPPAGTIFVDGVDIRELTLSSLRRQIVLAPQETFLFSTTVTRNIGLAQDAVDEGSDGMAELARFSQLAHLHDEVHNFIDGYDTLLGERGVNLSGGQRQRVAIARVMLKDAPILLLDEATSALDSEVESVIQRDLYRLMEGKTVIAIAHRLSTIAAMDRLIVMDQGRIVETGSHAELIAMNGLYARLWSHQSGGFLIDTDETS